MIDNPAIKVEQVSKEFKLPHEKQTSIKGALINLSRANKPNRGFERQQVLDNISFEIKKGEFFGIVGRNGSGKSTLLKMLAGIYMPTSGSMTINGKLTPFIELGVGFNPELTGRENIFLNGALLGFNRSEVRAMYSDIVEFAELENFMDQKLKNYSSGMQVRLAFSIAIRAQTEILLLDEVLAVGDADFQRKCYDYFLSLKDKGQTVILVTHDMGAVRQYCDRAIMIEKGKIVKEGTADSVAQEYQKLFTNNNEDTSDPKSERWGEGGIKILKPGIEVSDTTISITLRYKATKDLPPPIYGFTLFNNAGVNILEANTRKERQKTQSITQGEEISIKWEFANMLADGVYNLSVACCDQSATRFYQWVNHAARFNVTKHIQTAGLTNPTFTVVNTKESE